MVSIRAKDPWFRSIAGAALLLGALHAGLSLVWDPGAVRFETPWLYPVLQIGITMICLGVSFLALGLYLASRESVSRWAGICFGALGIGSAIGLLTWPGLLRPDGASTPLLVAWYWGQVVLFATGAVLAARRYRLSGHPLAAYLALSLTAFVFSALAARMDAGRFDLWWIWSRTVGTIGSLAMLVGLLSRYAGLLDQEREKARMARQWNETLESRVAERTAEAEGRARRLHALAVQLIETEERERRRFADLLHDDLQQLLASARLLLQAGQTGPSDHRADPDLIRTVNQLLEESISKARRLSYELSPAVLQHGGLVGALEWLARQMGEQYWLQVELEAVEPEPSVEEPLKVFLFRAVQEMLFNVLKHAQTQRARVHIFRSGASLQVVVSDRGRGFDPAVLQASTGSARGLGLFSIRERAASLGALLAIDSAPGKGSRLTLSVPYPPPGPGPAATRPLTAAIPPSLPPAADAALAGPAPFRVLLADDHRVMRQGLLNLIRHQPDIQVIGEASSGREAIEMARDLRPNVIVMDVSMPGLDGIEATRQIKAELPETRIIALSMHEEEHISGAMRRAGAEGFVSKAVSAGELLQAIYGMAERPPGSPADDGPGR